MINKLTLTNFRKHENAEFVFGPGNVVIRGANEAGKSTIYGAIIYALFGSRVLGIPVDDLVTYEKPIASMKVKCEVTLDGIEYVITRSKAGATIVGGGVSAQGQAEVTKFVETKLGVSGSVVGSLMIARQKDLTGSVTSGAGAVGLIEDLSNMDLIDTLVSNIQSRLPCGNTSSLETLLAQALSASPPPPLDPALALAVADTQAAALAAQEGVQAAQDALDTLDYTGALRTVEAAREEARQRAYMDGRLKALQAKRAAMIAPTPPEYKEEQVLAMQSAAAGEIALQAAYNKWLSISKPEPVIQMSRSVVEERIALARTTAAGLTANIHDLKVQKARLLSQRIDEPTCQWCLKDLSTVPEVASKNAEINTQIAAIDSKIQDNESALTLESKWLTPQITKALKDDDTLRNQLAPIIQYTASEGNNVPATYRWAGEIPTSKDLLDFNKLLQSTREQARRVLVHNELVSQTDAEIAELHANLLRSQSNATDPSAAQAVLDRHADLSAKLAQATRQSNQAVQDANHAKVALEIAQAAYEAAMQSYKREQQRASEIQETIKLYSQHNALIRKLREVRPVVAKQLWSIVLASVSNYFSSLRQTQSTVTRTSDGFMVDGKPVRDLSGSTQDVLGLSVRIALQKTFLPNINFIMLDEPGAGMDDGREMNMFGVLATAGYSQVMVVTHSDMADAFATTVVRI